MSGSPGWVERVVYKQVFIHREIKKAVANLDTKDIHIIDRIYIYICFYICICILNKYVWVCVHMVEDIVLKKVPGPGRKCSLSERCVRCSSVGPLYSGVSAIFLPCVGYCVLVIHSASAVGRTTSS